MSKTRRTRVNLGVVTPRVEVKPVVCELTDAEIENLIREGELQKNLNHDVLGKIIDTYNTKLKNASEILGVQWNGAYLIGHVRSIALAYAHYSILKKQTVEEPSVPLKE